MWYAQILCNEIALKYTDLHLDSQTILWVAPRSPSGEGSPFRAHFAVCQNVPVLCLMKKRTSKLNLFRLELSLPRISSRVPTRWCASTLWVFPLPLAACLCARTVLLISRKLHGYDSRFLSVIWNQFLCHFVLQVLPHSFLLKRSKVPFCRPQYQRNRTVVGRYTWISRFI